jgi:hypothetical protein
MPNSLEREIGHFLTLNKFVMKPTIPYYLDYKLIDNGDDYTVMFDLSEVRKP